MAHGQHGRLHALVMFFLTPLPFLIYGAYDHTSMLWVWYVFMCTFCAAGNLTLLAYVWRRTDPTDSYGVWMKWLALPWVWECAWRSVFPALYLQRFAFWDTPLNSIIVDRTWACLGELSWSFQVALALRQVDRDAARRQGKSCRIWIQACGWLSWFIYVAAECVSYYNTATTNEWWAGFEVFLDGLSFLFLAPPAIYLFFEIRGIPSSGKVYCVAMSITGIVYPLYNWFVDVPMYLARYREDQANHKKYFPFLEGLQDAATRRVVTRELNDWKADMFWMTIYFLAGAWSGIALMSAPRLPSSSLDDFRPAMVRDFELTPELTSMSTSELTQQTELAQARLTKLQSEALRRLCTTSA